MVGRTEGKLLDACAEIRARGGVAEPIVCDVMVAADIERLFGPVPAERLRTWGLATARALREAVARLARNGGVG